MLTVFRYDHRIRSVDCFLIQCSLKITKRYTHDAFYMLIQSSKNGLGGPLKIILLRGVLVDTVFCSIDQRTYEVLATAKKQHFCRRTGEISLIVFVNLYKLYGNMMNVNIRHTRKSKITKSQTITNRKMYPLMYPLYACIPRCGLPALFTPICNNIWCGPSVY